MQKGTKTKNPKLIFVRTTKDPEAVKEKIKDKKLVKFDLWVRTPDSEKLNQMRPKSRLCGSRSTCVAIIEDEL